MDKIPNYSEYTLASLEEVMKYIDREKYPDRVEIINKEIQKRKAEKESIVEPITQVANEPRIISDEEKRTETIKMVNIAAVVFVLSIIALYFNFSIKSFSFSQLPLLLISIMSLFSITNLMKKKYVGYELLMYSQIPLSFSFILGSFHYIYNMGYMTFFGISVKSRLIFLYNFSFGEFQFMLGQSESEFPFMIGLNILPLLLYAYLKINTDFYKRVFNS